jgi:hypothetical protein
MLRVRSAQIVRKLSHGWCAYVNTGGLAWWLGQPHASVHAIRAKALGCSAISFNGSEVPFNISCDFYATFE